MHGCLNDAILEQKESFSKKGRSFSKTNCCLFGINWLNVDLSNTFVFEISKMQRK